MRRSLVINADDMGYTRGINRAVDRCASRGMLRSATLMACGNAFEDAVAVAKRNPGLSIGVHLVLTGLRPLSRPADIPGLAGGEGLLPSGPDALLGGLLSGRISRRAVYRELELQVTKVLDHGIVPTHLDSHKHVHLLPQVLEAVVAVASRFSIGWVRNPFDGCSGRDLYPAVPPGCRATFFRQHLKSRTARLFRPSFLRILRQTGLRTPDQFFGVSLTGIWNEDSLRRLIRRVPPGLSEWMLHPGDCDEELLRLGSRLRESREIERDLLLSPVLRELVRENGITLAAFGEENA